MQWTEKYNVYKAQCGILELTCAWKNGAYVVTVNNRTLKATFRDIDKAKAAAVQHAWRLIGEASAVLKALELEGREES